jgi:hypothetical protein
LSRTDKWKLAGCGSGATGKWVVWVIMYLYIHQAENYPTLSTFIKLSSKFQVSVLDCTELYWLYNGSWIQHLPYVFEQQVSQNCTYNTDDMLYIVIKKNLGVQGIIILPNYCKEFYRNNVEISMTHLGSYIIKTWVVCVNRLLHKWLY